MGWAGVSLLFLGVLSPAAPITTANQQQQFTDSATAEFTQVNQFRPYTQQLTRDVGPHQVPHVPRSILSPHQQSNILPDPQQHRFQITVPPQQVRHNPVYPAFNNQFQPQQQGFQFHQQPEFNRQQQQKQRPNQPGHFAEPIYTQTQALPVAEFKIEQTQVETKPRFNPPPITKFQLSEATQFHQPERQRFPQPEVPRYHQAEPPRFHQAEPPSFQEAELPRFKLEPQKYQQPEATRFQAPEPPRFQQPELTRFQPEPPKFQRPELHRFQQPEVPKFQQPEFPKFQQPELPKFQEPELPKFQQPELPKFQQPELPKFQQPELPRFQQPEPPKFQQPEQPRFPDVETPRFRNDFRQQQYDSNNYLSQESFNKPNSHFQYLTEVSGQQPQVPFIASPTTDKTTYIIETQPPTTYRRQKPLEAITFSTEPYPSPTTPSTPPTSRPVKQRRPSKQKKEEKAQELYLKQKAYSEILVTPHTTVKTRSRTVKSTTTAPPTPADDDTIREELQRQLKEQIGDKDNPFGTLKLTLSGALTPEQIANLPQLAGLQDATVTREEPPAASLVPKGENVRIVQLGGKGGKRKGAPEIRIIHEPVASATTTVKPPSVLFEELKRGVLPPGADFELIRQKQDGDLENVGKLGSLPQKKVTFVILEEQPDGSVKVQGVKGNGDGEGEGERPDVDSIIEKLNKGEIKLPPSSGKTAGRSTATPAGSVTPEASVQSPSYAKHEGGGKGPTSRKAHGGPTAAPRAVTNLVHETAKRRRPGPTGTPSFVAANAGGNSHAGPVFAFASPSSTTARAPTTTTAPTPTPTPTPVPALKTRSEASTVFFPTSPPNHRPQPQDNLNNIFRSNGLFAMAKFLRQSGLDRVLNETGPYTIFVPTDRAFRSLLVQLGGPDRAERKFKQNPRLLSGLLLHHVIPGAFKLDTLQDEMTGVSLAGTQLRVNTYTTQDEEWNDLKVVTINGARVLKEMSDIEVPQGVAHAVDRVMFPLPVGDILQTLQADRESRFSKFLKLLEETGVAASLQGSKTYTVFAPTNEAFGPGEEEKLLEQRGAARALVLRHLTPGTLYSAGMHYYQLRDTMNSGKQITVFKEAGRVKVNNAQVVTRNLPATNGVIHAVDSIL